ncbi:hypothetical protein Y032_0641g1018 [Ancylostoma ceylanicum]|uniref:Uncharacterized protein n=1 Tax=Ancylostoma ceylanicum TaxID=53326 RepID=A0A016WKE0_9BILA|nr:hypothetical protein Y032_0641g1018 [Ancylostoma ceylanicum]
MANHIRCVRLTCVRQRDIASYSQRHEYTVQTNYKFWLGNTQLPFFLTYCIKNSEAHITIPGYPKILRIELLNDLMEICAVKERLILDGTEMRVEQYFACDPYKPEKDNPMRAYLACDPHFGHPVIVLMLKPFREHSIGSYLESFFYGWCASIVLSATFMILIIGCKPEMIVVQHNETSDRSEKHRNTGGTSLRAALTAARLKALVNLHAKSKKSTPVRSSDVKEREQEGTPKRVTKEETPNESATQSPAGEKKPKHQQSNEKLSRNQKNNQNKEIPQPKPKYGTLKDALKEKKRAKQKRN